MVDQQEVVLDTAQQCYTLTIARLSEFYVLNHDIKVTETSGVINCAIPNGENQVLTLPASTYNLHFQGQGCKSTATVNLTQNTTIVLKYNRLLGGLEVYVNDVKQNHSAGKSRLIVGIACGIVLACIAIPLLWLTMADNGHRSSLSAQQQIVSGTVIVDNGALNGVAFSLTKEAFTKAYNKEVLNMMNENGMDSTNPALAPLVLDDSKWVLQESSDDSVIRYEYSELTFKITIGVSSTTGNIFSISLWSTVPEVPFLTMYPFFTEMLMTLDQKAGEVCSLAANDSVDGIMANGICGNVAYTMGVFPDNGMLMMAAITDTMKAQFLADGQKEYFVQ